MERLDFDFQRYVRERRTIEEARLREGAGYAYAGDLSLLRSFAKIRPVSLATEVALQVFASTMRPALLERAERVAAESHPALAAALGDAAAALHIDPPPLYVGDPESGVASRSTPDAARPQEGSAAEGSDETSGREAGRAGAGPVQDVAFEPLLLGTNERPFIFLPERLLPELGPAEIRHFLGAACGHAQNGHTALLTTLHFLRRGGRIARWAGAPARLALSRWESRARVTADRAGLLATRSLADSMRAILIATLGSRREFDRHSGDEHMAALVESNEPLGRLGSLASVPGLPARLQALRAFAQTAYFRGATGLEGGISMQACDARVRALF